MLSESLTSNTVSLAKLSDNTPQGTLYQTGSGFDISMLAVRSTEPALGKSGTVRRLIQVSTPVNDPTLSVPTASSGRVTVNLTVTYPSGAEAAEVEDAIKLMTGALAGTTTAVTLSDFTTKVVAGHR